MSIGHDILIRTVCIEGMQATIMKLSASIAHQYSKAAFAKLLVLQQNKADVGFLVNP